MRKSLCVIMALVLALCLSPVAMAEDYTATAKGFGGDVTVTLTIEDGKLTAVKAEGPDETEGIGSKALEELPEAMVARNSVEVDTVASATVTSTAVLTAAADALAQAGVTLEPVEVEEEAKEPAKPTFENPDVIVIGAGFSGMNAALEAATNGAKVYLIDKNDDMGGSIRFAGGTTSAAGAKMQIEAGVEDSPENFQADIVRMGGGTNVAELTKKHTECAAAAVDWLDELGADFGDREPYFGVYQPLNVARNYSGNGGASAFITALSNELDNYIGKNAYIALNTRVEGLLTDENGAVVGVKATAADGSEVEYYAPATAICTGGYGGSEELLKQYNFDNILSTSPSFVTGDGYRWLEELGAAFTNMDFCTAYAGGIRTNPDNFFDFNYFDVTNGCLWVDVNGNRMANETGADSKVRSDSWSYADQNLVYTVFSKEMLNPEAGVFSGGAWGSVPEDFDTFMAQLIEQGLAFQADTIEELAEKAGLPVDAFTATITAYNEGCATGNDPFGRPEQLVPMENGPFYAVQTMPYVMITSGGPMMNVDCQVVRTDGSIIEGAYIAGEIVGMANVGGLNSIGGMGHDELLLQKPPSGHLARTGVF